MHFIRKNGAALPTAGTMVGLFNAGHASSSTANLA
jgi:hypothetical protein